jgi:hypothetical protein
MQPKIEQIVKDAIQPHLQPLLDKQVILEETVSQLQNNNAKKPHYDGYFAIFCLAYWMRSTYMVDV